MLEMTKRGISLMGEAYQTNFDKLRKEIKIGLSIIRLTDFMTIEEIYNNTLRGSVY